VIRKLAITNSGTYAITANPPRLSPKSRASSAEGSQPMTAATAKRAATTAP
jgi:hypothetical protein